MDGGTLLSLISSTQAFRHSLIHANNYKHYSYITRQKPTNVYRNQTKNLCRSQFLNRTISYLDDAFLACHVQTVLHHSSGPPFVWGQQSPNDLKSNNNDLHVPLSKSLRICWRWKEERKRNNLVLKYLISYGQFRNETSNLQPRKNVQFQKYY